MHIYIYYLLSTMLCIIMYQLFKNIQHDASLILDFQRAPLLQPLVGHGGSPTCPEISWGRHDLLSPARACIISVEQHIELYRYNIIIIKYRDIEL